MEAVEIRYEMEGEDRVHEISGEETRGREGRQESWAEEHVGELEG